MIINYKNKLALDIEKKKFIAELLSFEIKKSGGFMEDDDNKDYVYLCSELANEIFD